MSETLKKTFKPTKRTQKRRELKKKLLLYDSEKMLKAVKAVQNGQMSMKLAAKTYEVPRTSLMRKVKGEVPLVTKMGPQTSLTKEEDVLENYILAMAKKGFPLNSDNLMNSVGKIMKETKREH